MRKMDEYGLRLCTFQARLFTASVDQLQCSSKIFIRRFMNSKLAARIDAKGFLFDSMGIIGALEELDEQYGVSEYGQQKYSAEELYWIGYIYRYWCYISGKRSKQLFRQIKPDELRRLYFPYHSLDPEQAIERIREANGLDEKSEIERGVEIMRRVRNSGRWKAGG